MIITTYIISNLLYNSPWWYYFHNAHTHHLEGVDVPFRGYNLLPTFSPISLDQNSFIYFNIADIW